MYQIEKYSYNYNIKPIQQPPQQYQKIRVYRTHNPFYNYNNNLKLQQSPQQQQQFNSNFNYFGNNNKIIRKQIVINWPIEIQDKNNSTDNSSDSDTEKSDNNSKITSIDNNNNSNNNNNNKKNDTDKRLKQNRDVLCYLIAGDIIEYSKNNETWSENDRFWAIYAGNGYVIRFDKFTCQILIEEYWKLAKYFYMSCNIDLDRNYFCLPSHSVLDRARYALKNNEALRNYFSSDKNFVMWCRYDINKSDVEFSTNMNQCPQEASKYIMISRFLDCVEKHNSEFGVIDNDDEKEI